MNVIKAVRDYITKMVRTAQGMKVLLLDPDTVRSFALWPPPAPLLICGPDEYRVASI